MTPESTSERIEFFAWDESADGKRIRLEPKLDRQGNFVLHHPRDRKSGSAHGGDNRKTKDQAKVEMLLTGGYGMRMYHPIHKPTGVLLAAARIEVRRVPRRS